MAKKILLVDDDLDFLAMMGSRLRSWDYETVTASSGKEAIESLKGQVADVVILDYKMPDMDGVSVLKEIHRINEKIPVIMFTAYPDKESMVGSEKLGISVYLPKLSIYTDIHAVLKSALDMLTKVPLKKE